LLSLYIKTMVDAKDILEDRLQKTEGNCLIYSANLMTNREARKVLERELNLARTSSDDRRVSELTDRLNHLDQLIFDAEEDYKDFDADHKNLLLPFLKEDLSYRQSAIIHEPLLQQGYTSASVSHTRVADSSMRAHSQIFFRRSSKTLTILFFLSMVYFLL
jgi:hypothetical protein